MANEEHLKILGQGLEAWNKWRKENPGIRPDLSESDLIGAILAEANLRGANLRGARLLDAFLIGVDLGEADLSEANLKDANLLGAKLGTANLERADLRFCTLIKSNLNGATLTGAYLYGTARDDWQIKNVKCKYVYWDEEGQHRSPKDKNRDLKPGEFERLYEVLPTIEYIFENGMSPIDPLIMDRVVQAIRAKEPKFDIKIDSIDARGLAPSIKFTVRNEEQKETALEQVRSGFKERINRLEAEKDYLYELLGQAIDKAGVKLITAGAGSIIASGGSTINIKQEIHNAVELQRAIAEAPEESEGFAKVAKKEALDIIGGAMKEIAKGQVKEAAKLIIELGKDLGPIIANTVAFAFFKSILN